MPRHLQIGFSSVTVVQRKKNQELTYSELDERARQIAAGLIARQLSECRVVLMFPAGPDFICAFLGCLYAAATPIPCKVPNPRRDPDHLPGLVHNSTAAGSDDG